MVKLDKIILIVLLLLNSFYYFYYILNFESAALINYFWTIFFLAGIICSSYFLVKIFKKANYSLYLSLAVFITSITSLGAFGFRQLIEGFF